MSEEKIVLSKEDEEWVDDIEEEGMCYGNFSARAKACKECIISDKCEEETKGAKKSNK